MLGLKTPTIRQKSYAVFRGHADLGFGPAKSLLSLRGSRQFLIGHTGGWIANVEEDTGRAVEAFAVCKGPVNSMDLHSNGRFAAIGNGGEDQSIFVLKLSDEARFCPESDSMYKDVPEPIAKIALKADVRKLCFTDDGKYLLAALRNGEVLQLDCTNWAEQNRWKCHEGGVFAMDVSREFCVTGGTDGYLQLTRISDGTSVIRWAAHSKRIMEVLFSPDGTRIFSASHDGEIRIWNFKGERQHSLLAHVGPVACLELSSDGTTLISGGHDQRILLWDAVTGDLQREISAHSDQLTDLEFAANGGLLSSGLDSAISLWGDGSVQGKPNVPSQ